MSNPLYELVKPILELDLDDIDYESIINNTYDYYANPNERAPRSIGPALNPERIGQDLLGSIIGPSLVQQDLGPVSDLLEYVDPVLEGAASAIDVTTDVLDNLTAATMPVLDPIVRSVSGLGPVDYSEAAKIGQSYIENGYTLGNLVDFFTADYMEYMIGDHGEITPLDAVVIGGGVKRFIPFAKQTINHAFGLGKKLGFKSPKTAITETFLPELGFPGKGKEAERLWGNQVIERFFSETAGDLTLLKELYLSPRKYDQFRSMLSDKAQQTYSYSQYSEMINGMFTGEVPGLASALVVNRFSARTGENLQRLKLPQVNPMQDKEIQRQLVADVKNIVFDIKPDDSYAGFYRHGESTIHLNEYIRDPEYWLAFRKQSWKIMSSHRSTAIHEWTHMIHTTHPHKYRYNKLMIEFVKKVDNEMKDMPGWTNWGEINGKMKKNVEFWGMETSVSQDMMLSSWFEANGGKRIYNQVQKQLSDNTKAMNQVHKHIWENQVYPNLSPKIMPQIEDELSSMLASKAMMERIFGDINPFHIKMLHGGKDAHMMIPQRIEPYGPTYILGFDNWAIPSELITENVHAQARIKFQQMLKMNLDPKKNPVIGGKNPQGGLNNPYVQEFNRYADNIGNHHIHYLQWPVHSNKHQFGITGSFREFDSMNVFTTQRELNLLLEKELDLGMKFFDNYFLFTAQNKHFPKDMRYPHMHEVMARISELNLGSILNPTTPSKVGAGTIGNSAELRLLKYFEKETLDGLKDKIWGFALPIAPLAD